MWHSEPKGFFSQNWGVLTQFLPISESGHFIISQVEILESAEGTALKPQCPPSLESGCIFSGRREAP